MLQVYHAFPANRRVGRNDSVHAVPTHNSGNHQDGFVIEVRSDFHRQRYTASVLIRKFGTSIIELAQQIIKLIFGLEVAQILCVG